MRTLQMGSVFATVSTQDSMVAPSRSIVPRIFDVRVARMFAFTPLPIPSARITISESFVLSTSTLSPQSSSPCLFRLFQDTSILKLIPRLLTLPHSG